jgi:hypothetical protein
MMLTSLPERSEMVRNKRSMATGPPDTELVGDD